VGSSTANYQIYYRFYGISSHAAASPEKGRSALDAVELMNTGVQYLREHVIQEARIHYAITNTGGFSPNVVQPFAEVLYLIRAPKTSLVQEIYERINDIARGAALMTGTRMEMQFVKACSNLIDNTVLEEVMQKNLDELELPAYTEEEIAFAKQMADTYGGNKIDIQAVLTRYEKSKKASVEALLTPHIDDIISTAKVPLMDMEVAMAGSTDVSDVSWVCPTVQANICTLAAGTPGHSWQEVAQGKSTMAHKGMLYAGKVMAATAIDILESPETIEKAKEELAKRVGPEGYIAPIPKDVKPMAINPKK
jgi:aminobenzoyl-glutamate utilization protein B